jgi:opacity protein-like surface antigen
MNMKKLVLLATVFGAFSVAHADQYVSAKLGASIVKADSLSVYSSEYDLTTPAFLNNTYASDNEKDTVINASLAYGWAFESLPVRAELEYTFRGKADFNNTTNRAYLNSVGDVYDNGNADATVKSQSLMANVYYDFKNTSDFTPYVSAGIGASFNKLDVTEYQNIISSSASANDKKTDFAWSVGVGVNYALNKDLDLDLGYRYVDLGKVNTSTVIGWNGYYANGVNILGATVSDYEAKLKSHDFSLGLRYKF